MKSHTLLALVSSALAVSFAAPAATASPGPVGEWRIADGTAVVAIRPCGEELCGFVAGGDSDGKQVFFNMKQDGDQWSGTIVNVKDGEHYSGHISLVSESTLKVEGCVLGGLFCGGQKWSRVH